MSAGGRRSSRIGSVDEGFEGVGVAGARQARIMPYDPDLIDTGSESVVLNVRRPESVIAPRTAPVVQTRRHEPVRQWPPDELTRDEDEALVSAFLEHTGARG